MQEDSRQNFIDTFLQEMPIYTDPVDFSEKIVNDIQEMKLHGAKVINLDNNLKKIEGNTLVYYWIEERDQILLGVQLTKTRYGLVVNYIGKIHQGRPPFASDLYDKILKDRQSSGPNSLNNLVISDSILSDEGLSIWIRLLKSGHKVSLFNYEKPGKLIPINSVEDLKSYHSKTSHSFGKWRYVISESYHFAETAAIFRLRKLREDSGIL